ncbi:MAG: hypothetical protein Q9227_005187 [Pyrenula ochraceoflavens]
MSVAHYARETDREYHRDEVSSDNPTGTVAGNQHWGHATSRDLYHWENQPIAIFPPDDTSFVFSGSAIVDANNTSGFFPDQDNGVVAFWTRAVYNDDGSAGPQTQWLSYSRDGGYTFQNYDQNPVINSTSSQFRDPKVFYYSPGQHWVLVVAYAQEFAIGIFTSTNLKDWTHASNFTHHGLLGLQYECPNLVQIPMAGSSDPMYMMWISINPGAPLGGSISQYFPGTFNGTHFTAVDGAARIADFAKDNYAGQFFNGIPGTEHQVSIAWASNWQYSQDVPTGPLEGWRSSMSLPRSHYLANITRLGYDLISQPYNNLSPVLGSTLASNSSLGNGSLLVDFSTVPSGAIYFEANVTSIPAANTTGTLNFTFLSTTTGESLYGGQFFSGDTPFFLNRDQIRGYNNPFFTGQFSSNKLIDPDTQAYYLCGVMDRSIIEVFFGSAQVGENAGTATFFAEQPLDTMILKAGGLNEGVGVSAKVVAIESAWARYENMMGTVLGNNTQRVRRDSFRGNDLGW